MDVTSIVVGCPRSGALEMMGFLWRLDTMGILSQCTNRTGTCVGAYILLALEAGYSWLELTQVFFNHPDLQDYTPFRLHQRNCPHHLAIHMAQKPIKYMAATDLTLVVYNYTRREVEYVTGKTHPDLPLSHAVEMTLTLTVPFAQYRGCEYGSAQLIQPLAYRTGALHVKVEASVNPTMAAYEAMIRYRQNVKGVTIPAITASFQEKIEAGKELVAPTIATTPPAPYTPGHQE